MNLLKLVLMTSSILVFLDYSERAGNIILIIDISLERQRRVLIQIIKKKDTYQNMKMKFGLAQKKTMMQPSGNIEEF